MDQNQHRLSDVTGHVVDVTGQKIGPIASYYLDDATGEPTFVRIQGAGPDGTDALVPVHSARAQDGDLAVPYSAAEVAAAPALDADGHLDPEQEDALRAHFGDSATDPRTQAGAPLGQAPMPPAGHDPYAPVGGIDRDGDGIPDELPRLGRDEREGLGHEPATVHADHTAPARGTGIETQGASRLGEPLDPREQHTDAVNVPEHRGRHEAPNAEGDPSDIADPASGHNPLRTDPATHVEGGVQRDVHEDRRGDDEPQLWTRPPVG